MCDLGNVGGGGEGGEEGWLRSFLSFYFRDRAFSISRTRLPRSLEQTRGAVSSQAKRQPHAKGDATAMKIWII